jgi:hypothetical protein
MFAKYYCLMLMPGLLVLATSCNDVKTTTQIQHEHMDEMKCLAGAHLVHMVDNAMLQDMSIADHHFVAHTAEISGSGAERLDRFAPFLNAYGGVLRYETYCEDEPLVTQRMEHVREYLALAGCNMDRVAVQQMIAAGRGLPADDAVEIKTKGTAKPEGGAPSGDIGLSLGQ